METNENERNDRQDEPARQDEQPQPAPIFSEDLTFGTFVAGDPAESEED